LGKIQILHPPKTFDLLWLWSSCWLAYTTDYSYHFEFWYSNDSNLLWISI